MVPWRTVTVSSNVTQLFIAACRMRRQGGVDAEGPGLTDHLQGSPCIVPESIFEFELRGLQRDVNAARERSRPLILESNTISQQLPVSPLVPMRLMMTALSPYTLEATWQLTRGIEASYVELQVSYADAFDAPARAVLSQATFERELLLEDSLERVQLPLEANGKFTLSGCWQAVPIAGTGDNVEPLRHCISAFTLYRIRVVVRAPGLQSGAAVVYAASRPDRPASEPRNVTVISADATSAAVRLRLPSDARGVVEGIDIDIYGVSSSSASAELQALRLSSADFVRRDSVVISSTAALQAEAPDASFGVSVSELLPYHTYALRVRARTAAGLASLSASSVVVLSTLEAAPREPRRPQLRAMDGAMAGQGQPLELLWQMVNPPLGKVLSFDIEYAALNMSVQAITVNASDVLFEDGLYSILLPLNATEEDALVRVRAMTAAGLGPWSAQAVPYVAPSSSSPLFNSATAGAIGGAVALMLILISAVGAVVLRRRKRQVMFFAPPPDEYEIQRTQINLGSTLGSGAYGEVYDATAVGLMGNPNATRVAVKQCHAHSATVQAKREFIEEMTIMKVRGCRSGSGSNSLVAWKG